MDYVAEIKKPDAERLPSFHDAELESLRFEMLSPAPIYGEMEIASITGALHRGLNELGPDDPFLKIVLNGKTPEQAAADLVQGSKLQDPTVRKALIDGGPAAVDASTDSMIVLNRNSILCGASRPLCPLRPEYLSGRDFHSAPFLRHSPRLPHE